MRRNKSVSKPVTKTPIHKGRPNRMYSANALPTTYNDVELLYEIGLRIFSYFGNVGGNDGNFGSRMNKISSRGQRFYQKRKRRCSS